MTLYTPWQKLFTVWEFNIQMSSTLPENQTLLQGICKSWKQKWNWKLEMEMGTGNDRQNVEMVVRQERAHLETLSTLR